MTTHSDSEDIMTAEPRPARPPTSRGGLVALAERVTRVETTAEHMKETLARIDSNLSKMQHKIDGLANSMAQGVGGLRVAAMVGSLAAGIIGFLAAHFWPSGK